MTICFSAQILADSDPSSPVKIELFAEKQTIAPGDSFWVSLHCDLSDSWHAYWKNPGDAGMAPSIEWKLPEGFTLESVEWPVPERFVLDNAVTFGYAGDLDFLALIKAPSAVNDQAFIDIGAEVTWVVCSEDTCLPGLSEAHIKLPIGTSSENHEEHAPKIEDMLTKVTKKLQATAFRKDDFVHLKLDTELALNDEIKFFPEEGGIDFHHEPKLSKDNALVLKTADDSAKLLKGLVVAGNRSWAVETEIASAEPLQMGQPMKEPSNSIDPATFMMVLGFAFLGGMILNLMPCVLPVISFKVMSFVRMAQESRKKIFKHGIAFSIGVLASFWVLAGSLLVLRAYGHAVGWGFQLQDPLFVAILAELLLIFGLSQFGVFELGTSVARLAGEAELKSQGESYTSSFVSGIFATAVATPCTGPFLGSAVGYAVTVPPLFGLIIFTVLGLGMAFPYLAISAFPALLRWLPKPGAWMETLKQFMGFLMLATVLWLIWVFAAQTSETAIFILLASLLIASLGCWIYGKWGTPVRKKSVRLIGYVLTLACAAGAFTMIPVAIQAGDTGEKPAGSSHAELAWEPFSRERVAELRAKKIPVLIDFTAKWCLICQTNHLVLSNSEVEKKFKELGVVRMKADWTKKDSIITEELLKYGRSGVPLYLLYGSEQEPKVLPQVLTPENVIGSLNALL